MPGPSPGVVFWRHSTHLMSPSTFTTLHQNGAIQKKTCSKSIRLRGLAFGTASLS